MTGSLLVDPASAIRERLAAGEALSDSTFDDLLSSAARSRSALYWSRVEVAQTAARWFLEVGATSVLDVGAGAGKFCSVVSLLMRRPVWGLERRAELVVEARRLATLLAAEVVIIQGTLSTIEPALSLFAGYYFYNPFVDYVMRPSERYDASFEQSVDEYVADVRRVEGWLRAAPVGTALVSYCGLGGRIPFSWEVVRTKVVAGHCLRLWVKRRSFTTNDAFLELGDSVTVARPTAATPLEACVDPLLTRVARALTEP